MDFGDIFGNAQKAVEDAWGHITETGVPAVLAGIEQYGANQLSQMAQGHQAQAQQGAQNIIQSQQGISDPNSFAASLSNAFGGAFSGAAVKQYAPYILLGGAALAVLVYVAVKKK